MKKLSNLLGTLGLAFVVGCATIAALTPAQIATIGVVITQVANQGAVYAIQQDKNNAIYFKTAIPVLDNFANGTDLSPTALQIALAKVTQTNQWVNLAITAAVMAYDVSYSRYISDQLTNAPAAKAWIIAAETGFQQALAQTSSTSKKLAIAKLPFFYKNGKVDKSVIKAEIDAAARAKK